MQPVSPPSSVSQRRGNRVFIQIPIAVYGTELTGVDFSEKSVTDSVSRNGASVALSRQLGPDQEVTIKRDTGKEAVARIVGQTGTRDGNIIYATAFVEPQEDFWGITFADSTDPAAGKALLECCACHWREDVAMDEMELAVFMLKERLQRTCERCRASTIWRPVLNDGVADRQFLQPANPLPRPAPAPEERRRNGRTRMQKLACVRQRLREDIVRTVDVSRSGMRFRSRLSYEPDTWIEIAVPYIKDGANIFTPARIAWVKTGKEFYEYGVEYRGTKARVNTSPWGP